MSAVACPSIPLVVAEEGPATARLRTAMAQVEITTMVTVMAIITLQEVRLRLWHLRGTIPIRTRTPTATLVGELSPVPIPASTHLSSHLTPVRSAYPLATEGRCTAFPRT